MTQPIDYARADSADVVRKKHRRRVVWFVMATVVVMVIGVGRSSTWKWGTWEVNDLMPTSTLCVSSGGGSVTLFGPRRTRLDESWKDVASSLGVKSSKGVKVYGDSMIGLTFTRINGIGITKWWVSIRYRTLFTLAMIPWIITLIRLRRPGL